MDRTVFWGEIMSRVRSLRVGVVLFGVVLAACSGAPEQNIARGKDLYDTCVPCHGSDGSGSQVLGAPSIGGLPQWYVQGQLRTFQAGHRGYAPFDTIGIRMKSMALSLDLAGDDSSVAMYVASLPRPAVPGGHVQGDAQAGQTSYGVCATCHGPDGAGNEALHAPPLAHQHDWYLRAQLQKFHDGWRGTHEGDVWGAAMRPNAMMLDSAAMDNVVAYIQTFK
jgi:cytochrome c553